MGSNNNKNGNDPRGRTQQQSAYQQNRFENQQGPVVNAMGYNYGRGSEANYGDYSDIMNMYRGIASGTGSASGGDAGGGGGGGGGGGYTPFTIQYNDPFNSYAGFQDFSQNGGYSRNDVANMRARGNSPIRAVYANAEREMSRQRALQGGYSPNAFAALTRMSREQGQLAADATQNTEATLAEARNKGRLAGLEGMFGVEGQRLAADLDVQKYNAAANSSAQSANNAASSAAADRAAGSAAASRADQLRALQGMTQLYGTTPAMAGTFGNQLLTAVGQGGNFGTQLYGQDIQSQQLPGQYEQAMNRTNQGISTGQNIAGAVGTGLYAYNQYRNAQKPQVYAPDYVPGEI